MCVKERKEKREMTQFIANASAFCSNSFILSNKICYHFVWGEASTFLKHKKYLNKIQKPLNLTIFQSLFDATSNIKFAQIIERNLKSYIVVDRIFGFLSQAIVTKTVKGFYVDDAPARQHKTGGNLFLCEDRSTISIQYFCDNYDDCGGEVKSDEENCLCPESASNYSCKYTTNISCSPLFYLSHNKECHSYISLSDKKHPKKMTHKEDFTCSPQRDISPTLVDDLVVDCLSGKSDENVLKEVTDHNKFYPCFHEYQLPCRPGHIKCFNISDICILRLNSYNHLQPCRTGEHLQQCKHFACDFRFKCPQYYCLPWKYVCDGIWNCPYGMDESMGTKCKEKTCRDFFKCKSSRVCLHPAELCDDHADCPQADDETLCSLNDKICVAGCFCHTFSIICEKLFSSEELFAKVLTYKVVILSQVGINITSKTGFVSVVFLSIFEVDVFLSTNQFHKAQNLLSVKLHSNNIQKIPENVFGKTSVVVMFHVTENKLESVRKNTFLHLKGLMLLNLSSNPLAILEPQLLWMKRSIVVLLNISRMDKISTSWEISQIIQTSDPHLCCIVPERTDCFSTVANHVCQDLLPSLGNKISFYLTSVWIVVFNLCHIALQYKCYSAKCDKTFAYGTGAIAVSMSDLCCALQTILLSCADLNYKQSIGFLEYQWRSSSLCHIVLGVFTNFNLLSPVVLCLFSVSRLMVVLHPMDTKFTETVFVSSSFTKMYVFCISVTVSLTLIVANLHPLIPRKLCSPFEGHSQNVLFVRNLTIFFIYLQIVAALGIVFVYIMLFYSLKMSQKNMQAAKTKHNSNTPLVVQIVLFTSIHILCWIPSGIIYILMMSLEQYPEELFPWTVSAVASINSIMNPIVLSVIAIRKLISVK